MSPEAEGCRPTRQVLDTEGTDGNGVVTRVISRHERGVSGAGRAVRVAFSGFLSECSVRVVCNGGLTTVVTSLAPNEEDIELLIALSACGFGTDIVWGRAAEQW